MIGIALLGAGYAARIQLACWREIPGATVIGVWNRSAERARALAAEFGVPSFDELDALLDHPAVDAVDIATAVETHRDYALQAAASGKHVLCQKPLAPSFAEAVAIVRDCEAAGVRLMVNENWRWRPWYRAARDLLDRGVIGRPFSLRLASRSAAAVATPERPPESLFARQPFLRRMRPLIVLELGPHHFDIVRFLFGEPQDVYARTLKVTPAEHVAGEEVATTLLGYPDRLAQVELSWASLGYPADAVNPDVLAIEGTEGSLFVDHDGQVRVESSRRQAGDRSRSTPLMPTGAAGRQRSRTSPSVWHQASRSRPPATDNLNTLRLVFAAYDSAATHQVIPVSDDWTTTVIEPPEAV